MPHLFFKNRRSAHGHSLLAGPELVDRFLEIDAAKLYLSELALNKMEAQDSYLSHITQINTAAILIQLMKSPSIGITFFLL